MKNTAILSGLFLTILVLGGTSAYLLRERSSLQGQITASETESAASQATLVQVFQERQTVEAGLEITLEEQTAELAEQRLVVAELGVAATSAAVLAARPTSEAAVETEELDTPPQVRIILREQESIRPVGEPIDIIASAAHPIGIAALNITVNGNRSWSILPSTPG